MKKILLFLSLLLLLFVNEFTLVNFSTENYLKEYNLIKIRFFNLINFIFILLIYFYWADFNKLKIIPKFLISFLLLISIDYLSKYAGFGYGHDRSDYHRHIFPYDWVRGKPNVLDHNQFGFRGMVTPDIKRDKNKIVIALFGGSTGYYGDPTILQSVSNNLKKKGYSNIAINFSSVSSNHNQHLHRLLEFSEHKYDFIIFYGGGNETFQQLYYDPRPGFPYNFYMFENLTSPIFYLSKYSNIMGELDKQFKITFNFKSPTKLGENLRNPMNLNDEDFKIWSDQIKINYFTTLNKAKKISENIIKPNKCIRTSFLSFFQPINISDEKLKLLVNNVQKDLKKNNVKDLFYLKDKVIFRDIVHIDQNSKNLISDKISSEIINFIKKNC